MRNQMTHVLKCVGGMYSASYLMKTFCEKNPRKSYRKKNYRGVATTPLGVGGLNIVGASHKHL